MVCVLGFQPCTRRPPRDRDSALAISLSLSCACCPSIPAVLLVVRPLMILRGCRLPRFATPRKRGTPGTGVSAQLDSLGVDTSSTNAQARKTAHAGVERRVSRQAARLSACVRCAKCGSQWSRRHCACLKQPGVSAHTNTPLYCHCPAQQSLNL